MKGKTIPDFVPLNVAPRRRRIKDNLDLDAEAAAAAGMSYGQYKALHPYTKAARNLPEEPVTPTKRGVSYNVACAVCGCEITAKRRNRMYCSQKCRYRAGKQQNGAAAVLKSEEVTV